MPSSNDIEVHLPPFKELVNEKFAPIFKNRDRYIFLYGSRNSSKSVSTSRKLIYRCMKENYFRYILIKKTHESIKDSQWQTLKDDVDDLGLSELFTFRKQPLEIECYNGNKFIARGLDKADKIKSIKDPSGAWYEEGNQISEKDFITATTSIRSMKADYIQEIFSFNPECDTDYEKFWLWKMFFQGHAEKSFRDEITIELESGRKVTNNYTVMHSTYKDNVYLTDTQIADLEQWKAINPYYYKVFALGEWGNKNVQDRFWKSFDRLQHVQKVQLDLNLPLHICFDENVNPYPALTIWHIDIKETKTKERKLITQIHEICLTNPRNKVQEVAREFISWCTKNNWYNKIYIYGDATSDKEDTKLERGMNYFTMLRNAIQDAGYNVEIRKSAKNPPVAMSAEFVNACYAVEYEGIEITIGENCTESINDYQLAQEQTDGTMKKPKDKDGVEIIGHLSDTKRYLITEAFKSEFDRYRSRHSPGKGYSVPAPKKRGY